MRSIRKEIDYLYIRSDILSVTVRNSDSPHFQRHRPNLRRFSLLKISHTKHKTHQPPIQEEPQVISPGKNQPWRLAVRLLPLDICMAWIGTVLPPFAKLMSFLAYYA
jgi:hypothetical protein